MLDKEYVYNFIQLALEEDVKEGDHSSLSCIAPDAIGNAKLIFKSNGIAAGIELAEIILKFLDENVKVNVLIKDGETFKTGDIGFYAEGKIHALLKGERLLLNCMQRLSAIATETAKYVALINHTDCKLLDTRKTTPNLRYFEKWAVKIGGGHNHRFGLYDMIMLKDNHVDFCGSITKALESADAYLKRIKRTEIPIEIETRNIEEVREALNTGVADRIMLDNFTPKDISEALIEIGDKAETEASGGINYTTIKEYAETGVDYVSVGALTHGVKSLDISFKTVRKV